MKRLGPSLMANAVNALRWGFQIYECQVTSFGAVGGLMLSLILFATTRCHHSWFKENVWLHREKIWVLMHRFYVIKFEIIHIEYQSFCHAGGQDL